MLSFVLVRLQPFYFPFSFSLAFCFTKIMCETLCKFLYVYARLICIFMQGIMINRKLFGNFGLSAPLSQTFYLFTFSFLAFPSVWIIQKKTKTEKKKPYFAVIRPFLSQIMYWFSVIYPYIGQIAHHPPDFGTRRVGQLSSEIFYFLFFYFFCKILRFYQFSFSTEF